MGTSIAEWISSIGTGLGGLGIATYGADRFRARRDREVEALSEFRRRLQDMPTTSRMFFKGDDFTELNNAVYDLARTAHLRHTALGSRNRRAMQAWFDTANGWKFYVHRGQEAEMVGALNDFMNELSRYLSHAIDARWRDWWGGRYPIPRRPPNWNWQPPQQPGGGHEKAPPSKED